MKLRFTLVICLFLSILTAQSINKSKLDSLVSLLDTNNKGMFSISIFADGKEIYNNAIGYADMETKLKSSPDTKYRIGSISKMFTCTVIMQLVEENKLDLTTKLSVFYPQIINSDKITIEMLLRHCSGIFNFTNAPEYLSLINKPISHEEMINKIVSYGKSFEPDEKAEYSNSNYILLSYIAEKIEGKNLFDIFMTRIIKPSGLQNTYYGKKTNTNENEAKSYRWQDKWIPDTETDMSIPSGAGAVVSTPNDLNIFINNLFNGKYISPEALSLVTTLKDNYGLGIFRTPFYDKEGFGHSGGIDGFQSMLVYYPAEKVSVSVLSNGVVYPINEILKGCLSIIYNRDYKLPEFPRTIDLNAKDMEAFQGVYNNAGTKLRITVGLKNGKLFGKADGQEEFPLTPIAANKFVFEPAGLALEFILTEKKMILNQNSYILEFTKE